MLTHDKGFAAVIYSHPHPDPGHVAARYRTHIMACKRKWGTARGLIHYRAIVGEYLAAKRAHLKEQQP